MEPLSTCIGDDVEASRNVTAIDKSQNNMINHMTMEKCEIDMQLPSG